ncbi:hypothetical protein EDC23_1075 [Thiohalophilus thiocyanatoxydans]|uniref:Uncharacterized protein n=1 Tax=Thiohalophilus thiocyanatoxydans TaxID=381308 RepID=A0A4R8IQ59_9GAMM|nr:hypothetical protein EDC23_1075 [Thiohalophilus thiocyanatoxydans]
MRQSKPPRYKHYRDRNTTAVRVRPRPKGIAGAEPLDDPSRRSHHHQYSRSHGSKPLPQKTARRTQHSALSTQHSALSTIIFCQLQTEDCQLCLLQTDNCRLLLLQNQKNGAKRRSSIQHSKLKTQNFSLLFAQHSELRTQNFNLYPLYRSRITRNLIIIGQQQQPFHLGLRNQQPVEGITVNGG